MVSLIVGKPVAGSWWGHPAGHAVYRALNELADNPDVVTAKLISRKVTFVHRRFWPHLAAVGLAREPWQTQGLSPEGSALLKLVGKLRSLRSDDPAVFAAVRPKRPAVTALELEQRLLVFGSEVHTETGAHAKVLEDWRHWARKTGVPAGANARTAKAELDRAVNDLNRRFGASGRLPWWR